MPGVGTHTNLEFIYFLGNLDISMDEDRAVGKVLHQLLEMGSWAFGDRRGRAITAIVTPSATVASTPETWPAQVDSAVTRSSHNQWYTQVTTEQ